MIAIAGSIALASAFGLVAIWGLYPLAIAAVARTRPRRTISVSDASPRSVSVVLVTREAAPQVIERVRDLIRTDYPADQFEIIVAHDNRGSAIDISGAEFEQYSIRCVQGDEPGGKAAGLNAGVRSALGEIIVFADTHQRYDPGTIASLAAPFDHPDIGAVTGNYRLADGGGSLVRLYWAFEKWLRRNEAAVSSTIGATGAVWAMRRSLWQPLPAGLILDDLWTPMRIVLSGSRVAVAERAIAVETRQHAAGTEYARKVRTLTGVIQLCAWMPALLVPLRNPLWLQFVFHKLLRLLTPFLVIAPGLWLLAAVITRLATPILVAVMAVLVGLVATVAFGRGQATSRIRKLVAEATLMGFAVIVAVYNGLRRNWRVWD